MKMEMISPINQDQVGGRVVGVIAINMMDVKPIIQPVTKPCFRPVCVAIKPH